MGEIRSIGAKILLSSATVYSLNELEKQYRLDKTYIVDLINDFNLRRMKAVTEGTRKKRIKKAPEEIAVVKKLFQCVARYFWQKGT
jgi:glycosylphosphatidylinositol transamidase (GPIT) subunit GPI8